MAHENLKERTFQFALRILEVVDVMPNSAKGRNIGSQLCRCGTSVAANYRAAARAKSRAEQISSIS
jgi:four helix bundle protein